MKTLIVFLSLCSSVCAADYTLSGVWNTDKGKILDGTMTCRAKYNKETKLWKGVFSGKWRFKGSESLYDYGPYDAEWSWKKSEGNNIAGTTDVDGARYTWKGKMSGKKFIAEFQSNFYHGYFDLDLKDIDGKGIK